MKILVLSAFFLAMSYPYEFFLVVIRKRLLLLPVFVIACVLAVAFNYAAIRKGWGIVGVAFATVLVSSIRYSAQFFLSSAHLWSKWEAIKKYVWALLKFMFMASVLLTLDRLFPSTDQSLFLTAVKTAVISAIYLPFILKLGKELGVFAAIGERWFALKPTVQEV